MKPPTTIDADAFNQDLTTLFSQGFVDQLPMGLGNLLVKIYFLTGLKPSEVVLSSLKALNIDDTPAQMQYAQLQLLAKRSESVLIKVAVLLLVGHWLDLYIIAGPIVMPDGPSVGPWELAPLLVLLPLFVLFLFGVIARHPLVARGDPYLVESLHHDV